MSCYAPSATPPGSRTSVTDDWYHTRPHDLEIGIYRRDQNALRDHLQRYEWHKSVDNQWVPWQPGEQLQLPVHQILAARADHDPPEVEFMLNESTDIHWLSRRHPDLFLPLADVSIHCALNLPILAPEIQLLFKAKHTRPKDQADFDLIRPRLNSVQREWLAAALRQHHPDHPWLHALES